MIQHFKKLISLFHKNYFDKLIITFDAIDIISIIARPMIKSTTKPIKQKQSCRAKDTSNPDRKNQVNVYDVFELFLAMKIR